MCILYITILHYHTSLIEEGGDWDRRNRLKVYEGLYAMSIRDFKTASKNFFDTAATFTSYELMSFDTFVKYAVLSCLVAMDRNELKKNVGSSYFVNDLLNDRPLQVIEGSEVQEALHSQSELNTLVRSLYECHYDQFFISLGKPTYQKLVRLEYFKIVYSVGRRPAEKGLLFGTTHTILSKGNEDHCLHTAVGILSVIIIATHGTSFWHQ